MFSDESLENSFNALAEKASGLNKRLDNVSTDIKNLESKLKELGIAFMVRVEVIPRLPLSSHEIRIVKESGLDDCLDEFFALESLVWEKCSDSNCYRLFALRELGCDDGALLGHFGKDAEFLKRPLIECPVPVRLRLHEYLGKLVDEIQQTFN